MQKSMERLGLGDSTYLPEAFFKEQSNPSMEDARRESEMAIFGAVDELLAKTRVKGRDIGIVVVNCCIFTVAPSLSSMVVNRYKMKEGVVCYNLSGMGCTAGLLAINLAKQLLQVHHNCYALVVSTESISQSCYTGNEPSKATSNCVFRVGGAAILLSNQPSDQYSSKYQLIHTVYTQTANSDKSYGCITLEEDTEGHLGVTVTKDLLTAAVTVVQSNIASLAPLVLPVPEQVRYLLDYVTRRSASGRILSRTYRISRGLSITSCRMLVGERCRTRCRRSWGLRKATWKLLARMTIYRFGNTSSSSVCVIWRAIGSVDRRDKVNVWSDEIDEFPVDLNNDPKLFYFSEPSN
ncbi:hypothetical protein Vadar_015115 [Vaccinium darrowii]|uniref:Uncharacterized protein n=1 Tax=Vaccinium darrowii TaxID=229202 RepID=A0ACB7ZCT1_9ERIC|nr:hypothetical protein Vadar_015115 [Vaccinium darrowii]